MNKDRYLAAMKASSVLLVDDDEWVREALGRYFRKVAGRFCAAPDAESALARIGDQPWDVVLCDYRLPGMDGIALLRLLTERSECARAFLITAYPEAEHLLDRAQLQVDGLIRKPLTIDAIERALASAPEGGNGGR